MGWHDFAYSEILYRYCVRLHTTDWVGVVITYLIRQCRAMSFILLCHSLWQWNTQSGIQLRFWGWNW
jgi:hypothetical protein